VRKERNFFSNVKMLEGEKKKEEEEEEKKF
jgi:hypothetical protein